MTVPSKDRRSPHAHPCPSAWQADAGARDGHGRTSPRASATRVCDHDSPAPDRRQLDGSTPSGTKRLPRRWRRIAGTPTEPGARAEGEQGAETMATSFRADKRMNPGAR